MNNIDKQYQTLLQTILDFGVEKKDRTGTGTKSIFGYTIRHKMSEGFPLLTTKKMHWNSVVTELLWFLRGETNIKFLLDYDCHIWDGDAYKNYIAKFYENNKGAQPNTKEAFIAKIKHEPEYAEEWGDLGPIYGAQWRSWDWDLNPDPIDQIVNLIEQLKTNPDSRRLLVSAWNVGALESMVLPPCHYGFQIYTRELNKGERMDYWFKNHKPNRDVCDSVDESSEEEQHKYFDGANVPKRSISLMWNQRSVDTFLGLPFNIASYALLLEIIAKEVNMVPDEVIGNLGDVHLYMNHLEQAKEQITRTSFDLPSVQITERNWYLHHAVKEHLGEKTFSEKLMSYRPECFELINYQSQPKLRAPLSN